MALEGDAFNGTFGFGSGSATARVASGREVFSLVGDVEPISRSIASSTALSRRDSGSACAPAWGEWVCESALVDATEAREARGVLAVGVVAGEDFVGEMDRARSASAKVLSAGCFPFQGQDDLSHRAHVQESDSIPARRACRSARPCRISSSSLLLRSSSSWSRLSPNSLMRWRKSLTSSELSPGAGWVDMMAGCQDWVYRINI